MAFISGQTNRRLGKKEPATYLPAIIQERGEVALTSQAVPIDPSLHQVSSYRDFLIARRDELTEIVNAHIESALEV